MPTTARTPRNVGNTSCSIKGVNSIRDIDNSRDNSGNKGVSSSKGSRIIMGRYQ
jgi:hypothetical protein